MSAAEGYVGGYGPAGHRSRILEAIGEADVHAVIRECRSRLEAAGLVKAPEGPAEARIVSPLRIFVLEDGGRIRETSYVPAVPWGCFVLFSDGTVARMIYDGERPGAP